MTADGCQDADRIFSIIERYKALEADLLWDALQRRREARYIALATVSGWTQVAGRLVFVLGSAMAIIAGLAGHLDVVGLFRGLR